MEMICIMHEAEPRGSLLINGQQVSGKQLAMLVGLPLKEVALLLGELAGAGVFSREDNGIIYSRRMRREGEKAERDKANGSLGGNPTLIQGVNPPDIREDKAYKLEARSQILDKESSLRSLPREEPIKKSRRKPQTTLGDGWVFAPSTEEYAKKQGLSERDFLREVERFRNHANQTDRRCADWDSALRNWCLKCAEDRGLSPVDAQKTVQSIGFYAESDSLELAKWDAHHRATTGRNAPRDRNGGWRFPSQWPPGSGPPIDNQKSVAA
jgi:hypothetical protein